MRIPPNDKRRVHGSRNIKGPRTRAGPFTYLKPSIYAKAIGTFRQSTVGNY